MKNLKILLNKKQTPKSPQGSVAHMCMCVLVINNILSGKFKLPRPINVSRSVVSMTLSEEEYNRHRATFTALDVNKDGTITLAEMQKVLLSKGIECKTEDLIKLMDSADKDRNSSISWQEYLSMVIKLNQQTQKKIKDRQEEELRQAFNLVDTDGNGIVTFEEFITLFQVIYALLW